jgi:hypothetical protein
MCRRLLAVLVGLSVQSLPAVAAPVVHDSLAEFTSIVNRQAAGVAPARSNLAAMFDNSLSISATSFFSLGLSPTASSAAAAPVTAPFGSAPTASLDFFIAAGREITSGAFSEATGTATGHAEQADVYLGRSGGADWHRIGTVHNGHGLSPAAPNGRVLNADPMVTWVVQSVTSVTGGLAYSFSFEVKSGSWNALRIVDGRASSGSGRDGFDILEFELTSALVTAVPEPATGALLGFGVLMLAGAGLRRPRGAQPG